MAFLQDLVDGNQSLECLHFIRQDGLPVFGISALALDSVSLRALEALSPGARKGAEP